jgi:hypothetical protein
MEEWNIGMLGKKRTAQTPYSIIPLFQYSSETLSAESYFLS